MQGCDADPGRLITTCGLARSASHLRPQLGYTLGWLHRPEKQHAPEKSVCPGSQRCSYVFMVAWPALLQLVRGSVRLGRPSALLRGAFCACRSRCWLLAFYQVWQFEPCGSPGVWWSSMLGSVSAGSAKAHLFLACRRHRMGRPTKCGIAWTAAGRLVRLWGFVFLLARTCGETAPQST